MCSLLHRISQFAWQGDIPSKRRPVGSYSKWNIINEIPNECLRKVSLHITNKDQSFYKNTGEFYKSVATETNLDAKYEGSFTLGATLDVTTKSVSGSKREVSGTSLNLVTKGYEQQLKPDCWYQTKLHSRLVRDVLALEKKITSPWLRTSWRKYERYENQGCSLNYIVPFATSG